MINRKKLSAMAVVGALTVSTVFTGCGQKTIDYDIDGPGDSSSNSSSTGGDSGSLKDRLGIPDSYEGNIDIGNTGLSKIEIDDDDIQVPETDKMNVVHATVTTFTNEFKQNLCESVFDKSKGIYTYDYDNQTKSDLQQQIDEYEQYKEQEQENGGDGSWYDEYINEMKAKLPEAPDEYPDAGDYSGDSFKGTIGDNDFTMYFSSSADGDGENSFGLYMNGSQLDYKPYEGATDVYYSNGQYSDGYDEEDSTNECSLSKDDAQQKAEDFLSGAGITNYVMTSIDDLVWEYQDSSWNTIATVADGYIVNFSRAIDGVATYDARLWNVSNLSQDDAYVNIPAETYSVYIDDNGILSFNGTDQLAPTGDEETNVDLLTWDELLAKANETIPAYNDVRLTYYIANDPDNEGQFEYIPVWTFSQYDDYQGSAESTYPEQLVVLDARDGSVLDLLDISKKLGCYQTYDDDEDDDVVVDTVSSYDTDEDDGEEADDVVDDAADDTADDGADDTADDGADDTADDGADEAE
jgi:hypothetical protein